MPASGDASGGAAGASGSGGRGGKVLWGKSGGGRWWPCVLLSAGGSGTTAGLEAVADRLTRKQLAEQVSK